MVGYVGVTEGEYLHSSIEYQRMILNLRFLLSVHPFVQVREWVGEREGFLCVVPANACCDFVRSSAIIYKLNERMNG